VFPPTQEAIEAMHKYYGAVAAAGIGLVEGAGPTNSSQGKRVAFNGAGRFDSPSVADGRTQGFMASDKSHA